MCHHLIKYILPISFPTSRIPLYCFKSPTFFKSKTQTVKLHASKAILVAHFMCVASNLLQYLPKFLSLYLAHQQSFSNHGQKTVLKENITTLFPTTTTKNLSESLHDFADNNVHLKPLKTLTVLLSAS